MTALLKFRQGAQIGPDGRSIIVNTDEAVVIENSDNTGIQSFRIELLYGPPGSIFEVEPGSPVILSEGNGIPFASLIPELGKSGCYRIRLTVWTDLGFSGEHDIDIRNIGVPTPNKHYIKPPYQRYPNPLDDKPEELNFDGYNWGWSGPEYIEAPRPFRFLNALIDELDGVASRKDLVVPILSGVVSTNLTTFDTISVVAFNPNSLAPADPGKTREVYFETVLWTTTDMTAELRLWNMTDGVVVPATTLSTTEVLPEYKSSGVSLTLPNDLKTYILQLRISSGTPGDLDKAFCSACQFKIVWQ